MVVFPRRPEDHLAAVHARDSPHPVAIVLSAAAQVLHEPELDELFHVTMDLPRRPVEVPGDLAQRHPRGAVYVSRPRVGLEHLRCSQRHAAVVRRRVLEVSQRCVEAQEGVALGAPLRLVRRRRRRDLSEAGRFTRPSRGAAQLLRESASGGVTLKPALALEGGVLSQFLCRPPAPVTGRRFRVRVTIGRLPNRGAAPAR